jgi:hypothetical protein
MMTDIGKFERVKNYIDANKYLKIQKDMKKIKVPVRPSMNTLKNSGI